MSLKKSYYIFSLGCKVNSYESHAVGEELKEHGYAEEADPSKAGLIIINTCSVTSTADQKSRQHISHFRKANPDAVIVVMGCYSQWHAEESLDKGADLVLGAKHRSEILPLVDSFLKDQKKKSLVEPSLRHESYEELGCHAYSESARAYLKIQDGCDNFCSYCLIPTVRGNSRSRGIEDTLEEAHDLCLQGYKEIIISGIHIGGYGKDIGDGSYRLADLLEDMALQNPDLYRIRVSSIEESEIDEKFLSLLGKRSCIVDHLHIPLQSGSSTVLQRMKRKYDTEAFLQKLDAIRKIRPSIAITTDVIVGFPLESKAEFEETMAFCRRCDFAEIHVFPFSSRPGTYAASLPQLDPKIKKERVHRLLSLSKELRLSYEKRFYGKEVEVLYEDFDASTKTAYGHTSNYLLIKTPSDHPMHGEVKKVIFDAKMAAD